MDDVTKTDKMLSRKDGGVGYVIFNNPERHNAVSLEMWDGDEPHPRRLRQATTRCAWWCSPARAARPSCPAPTSRSSRASAPRARRPSTTTQTVEKAYAGIHEFPKPTIAMIRGYCIGGGLGLAVCCDLRICSDNSRFAVPAAKLGLGYGYAGLKRLIDVVGPAFAKEIFFTARQFDAEEAQRWASSTASCRRPSSRAYVKNYADTIAANAPLTVKAVKYIVGEVLKDESKRDLARCAEMVEHCFASHDYIEGRTAFMEKRKPAFTGTRARAASQQPEGSPRTTEHR